MPGDDYDHPDAAGGVFYSPSNVPGKGCDPELFDLVYEGCAAGCRCTAGSGCPCIARSSGRNNYDANGVFLKLDVSQDPHIVDMRQKCSNALPSL